MGRFIAATIAAMVLGGVAHAAPIAPDTFKMQTFGDLVTVCGSPEEDAAQFCRGWLVGNGTLYLKLVDAGAIRKWACADPIPSLDDIRRAVVAYGETNRQLLQESAIDGFWRAAASIWPCPK